MKLNHFMAFFLNFNLTEKNRIDVCQPLLTRIDRSNLFLKLTFHNQHQLSLISFIGIHHHENLRLIFSTKKNEHKAVVKKTCLLCQNSR